MEEVLAYIREYMRLPEEHEEPSVYYSKKGSNNTYLHKPAGQIDTSSGVNYRRVNVFAGGKRHCLRVHHISWFLNTGEWPAQEIDHKDRNGLNNQPSNLRCATPFQNAQNQNAKGNNTSGFKGVSYCKKYHGWQAKITTNYKMQNKYFHLLALPQALEWRKNKEQELHT